MDFVATFAAGICLGSALYNFAEKRYKWVALLTAISAANVACVFFL